MLWLRRCLPILAVIFWLCSDSLYASNVTADTWEIEGQLRISTSCMLTARESMQLNTSFLSDAALIVCDTNGAVTIDFGKSTPSFYVQEDGNGIRVDGDDEVTIIFRRIPQFIRENPRNLSVAILGSEKTNIIFEGIRASQMSHVPIQCATIIYELEPEESIEEPPAEENGEPIWIPSDPSNSEDQNPGQSVELHPYIPPENNNETQDEGTESAERLQDFRSFHCIYGFFSCLQMMNEDVCLLPVQNLQCCILGRIIHRSYSGENFYYVGEFLSHCRQWMGVPASLYLTMGRISLVHGNIAHESFVHHLASFRWRVDGEQFTWQVATSGDFMRHGDGNVAKDHRWNRGFSGKCSCEHHLPALHCQNWLWQATFRHAYGQQCLLWKSRRRSGDEAIRVWQNFLQLCPLMEVSSLHSNFLWQFSIEWGHVFGQHVRGEYELSLPRNSLKGKIFCACEPFAHWPISVSAEWGRDTIAHHLCTAISIMRIF